MAYSNDLEKSHVDKLEKGALDLILRGNTGVFMVITNNPGRFKGKNYQKSIIITKNTSGGNFVGGASFTNTNPQTKQKLTWEPARKYKPVVIDQSEIDINAVDPEAAYDMKKEAMEEAANSMADDLGTDFYGTGENDAIDGLRKIIDDGTGTNAGTYAGILRSSLTNNNLDSYIYDANAALSTSNDEYLDLAFTTATINHETPDLIITDKTTWAAAKATISVTYQVNSYQVGKESMTRYGLNAGGSAQGVNIGFTAINFNGAGMIFDDKCPATYMFFINRKWLKWLGLPSTEDGAKVVSFGQNAQIEGVYQGMKSENVGLTFRGFFKDPQRYGSVGQFILQGQLISTDPRKMAKLIYG